VSTPPARRGTTRASQSTRAKTVGFGFDPEQSPYHFAVVPDSRGNVTIVERFAWGDTDDEEPLDSTKVKLSAYLWGRIAEATASEFNRRLRDADLRPASWNKGDTALAPHFGKELTLLAWAIENQDADPTVIPSMIANWSGLAPEERWWFYTTINATSAHADHGKDRGWRRAIKIAFAENPVQLPSSALLIGPMPTPAKSRGATRDTTRKRPTTEEAASQGRLSLWDLEEQTK
jgi:Protein of unknown function (DUF3780)